MCKNLAAKVLSFEAGLMLGISGKVSRLNGKKILIVEVVQQLPSFSCLLKYGYHCSDE